MITNIQNSKPKTVVFDLGNVLIPFDHSKWISNFNRVEQGLGDKMMRKFLDNHHFQMEYEGGKISDKDFINVCLDWLDNSISSDGFCKIFSDIFSLNQNVIDLLPELKKRYKLVLLSNTSNIHRTYAWGKYPFIENFDKLILSYEVGAVKPEPKIYKAVENFTKDKPEAHIFIDDILDYVNAAKKMGWDGVHFTGYDNLLEEFRIKGIL